MSDKPRRVIVIGDRHWFDRALAAWCLGWLCARLGRNIVVVHGGASGVDSSFNLAAQDIGIATEPHFAQWHEFGKSAGPRRNGEMVAAGAELCLALHRSLASSKGTRDCTQRCLDAGIPVWLLAAEGDEPRQIFSI